MEINTTDPPVHPFAALFPMLPDDELDELAEDIKANGLHHPIVFDQDGNLCDGRNRLKACRQVDVEPTSMTLPDGVNPVAFILSENVRRRHLTKSQVAMAVAKARQLLFATNNSDLASQDEVAEAGGVSQAQLAKAEVVWREAPDLADEVLAGVTSVQAGYDAVQRRKRIAERPDLAEEVGVPAAEQVADEPESTTEPDLARIRQEREHYQSLADFDRDVWTTAVEWVHAYGEAVKAVPTSGYLREVLDCMENVVLKQEEGSLSPRRRDILDAVKERGDILTAAARAERTEAVQPGEVSFGLSAAVREQARRDYDHVLAVASAVRALDDVLHQPQIQHTLKVSMLPDAHYIRHALSGSGLKQAVREFNKHAALDPVRDNPYGPSDTAQADGQQQQATDDEPAAGAGAAQ